jgi:hypothetical protein
MPTTYRLWVGSLILFIAAAGARAEVKAQTAVQLPSPAFAMAISHKAKTVAISHAEEGVTRLYPKLLTDATLDGAKEFKGVAPPTCLVHREMDGRGVFLVATQDDQTLHLLDDRTFASVGEVKLKAGNLRSLAVPADPAVTVAYYVACTGNSGDASIGRIDLKKRADEGLIGYTVSWSNDDLAPLAVSADGRTGYVREFNRMVAVRLGDGKPVLIQSKSAQGDPAADPSGAYVLTDKEMWTADLSRSVTKFPSPVHAFIPGRPLVVGMTRKRELSVFSLNTFKQVAKLAPVSLPKPALPPIQAAKLPAPGDTTGRYSATYPDDQKEPPQPLRNQMFRRGMPYPFLIAADEGTKTLLASRVAVLVVGPLSAIDPKGEPMLAATVKSTTTDAAVGVPMVLKLDAIAKGVTAALAEGAPVGMKLTGNQITWTPQPSQVGTHVIALRLSGAKDAERKQELTIVVRRPSVELPVAPDLITVTPDGKRVALVQTAVYPRQSKSERGETSSRVIVVDVEAGRITADRALPYLASSLAGATNDTLLSTTGMLDAAHALSLKDLAERKRVMTAGKTVSASVYRGMLVAAEQAEARDASSAAVYYRLPDLEPIDASAAPRWQPFTLDHRVYRVGKDGVFIDGAVLGSADVRARLLVQPAGFFELITAQGRVRLVSGKSSNDQQYWPIASTWGIVKTGDALQHMTGQSIASTSRIGNEAKLLLAVPALADPVTTQGQYVQTSNASPAMRKGDIVLRDLITGAARQTLPVFAEPLTLEREEGRQPPEGRVFEAGSRLLAVFRKRMYVVPISEIKVSDFPPPVYLEPAQEALILSSVEPLKLSCTAVGGRAPYAFASANEMPGVTVDPASGVMTIDPAPFVERAAQWMPEILQSVRRDHRGQGPTGIGETAIAAAAALHRERFKDLTGQEARGYPFAVPADVVVRDADGQSTLLNRVVLIDVPITTLSKRMAEIAEERRLAYERQRKASTRMAQPVRPTTKAAPSTRQLDDLEKRMAELEAQNRELRSRLRKPATQP